MKRAAPGMPTLLHATFGVAALASPAQATLSDDIAARSYTATCETTEICRETSGCVAFPTFGALHLSITGSTGQLGPSPDDPRPLSVYHALDAAPPDPGDLAPRFVVEQPSEDAWTRRFAYVDQTRAGPQGQYFMLDCTESPQ